jgi:hypothetical protein
VATGGSLECHHEVLTCMRARPGVSLSLSLISRGSSQAPGLWSVVTGESGSLESGWDGEEGESESACQPVPR